jgi:hypothetical protein
VRAVREVINGISPLSHPLSRRPDSKRLMHDDISKGAAMKARIQRVPPRAMQAMLGLQKYVKVAFFRGASLRPLPPGESKHKDVRYLDIREDDRLDVDLLAKWVRQASKLPGWMP